MNVFWKVIYIASIIVEISACATKTPQQIIAKGATVEKLAEGFKFTEGPAADKEGNVYFTDQPNNRILKWSVDNTLTVFLAEAGRSNGLYFDNAGNLIACADMDNQLWLIDKNGNHTILVNEFEGKKLNGPNDLWIAPDGAIFFTDPLYKRPYWDRNPEKQQDGDHVYYLSPNKNILKRVATGLVRPNGIIGTADGKTLYVSDIGDKKTYVYNVQPDGTLSERKLFTDMGSDGMTIDNKGNIYLTGNGVTVFNSAGTQIAHIPIEANWTANVTFGGKNRDILFITASEFLYGLKMNVKGL